MFSNIPLNSEISLSLYIHTIPNPHLYIYIPMKIPIYFPIKFPPSVDALRLCCHRWSPLDPPTLRHRPASCDEPEMESKFSSGKVKKNSIAMGKRWENIGNMWETCGKHMGNDGKIWENVGKCWKLWKYMDRKKWENVGTYGKEWDMNGIWMVNKRDIDD